jgi:hypothetical protein
MTTPNDDQFTDLTDPNEPTWRQQLRAEAKAGREAVARAEAAEAAAKAATRELAMRRAGVDMDSPLGSMFAKAYDGTDDVDTIKNSWGEVAGIAPPQQQSADAAALARISQAAGGGTPSGGAPVDFEAELDSIPYLVDGAPNPNYVQQVLSKTAEQAAREGRTFTAQGAGIAKWNNSGGPSTPATNPL